MTAQEPVSLILTGPTGIGKTAVAVELALRHPFELISADSMQVYRGMEIGTAQPTAEELHGAPIHGCGILTPDNPFSAQRFVDFCAQAHAAILERARIPLYVGGTGLYLRALRWGLFKNPSASADNLPDESTLVRQGLRREAGQLGVEALYRRLTHVDPEYAARTGARDEIRIVRALEVFALTRMKLSDLQAQWANPEPRFPHRLVVLQCARETLVRRIENRVDSMLKRGWIDEVRLLLQSGYHPGLHSFKALGYRDVAEHLAGRLGMDEMRERICAQTRQYAKRQMTWFRKEREAVWVDYDGVSSEQAVRQIEKVLDLQRMVN